MSVQLTFVQSIVLCSNHLWRYFTPWVNSLTEEKGCVFKCYTQYGASRVHRYTLDNSISNSAKSVIYVFWSINIVNDDDDEHQRCFGQSIRVISLRVAAVVSLKWKKLAELPRSQAAYCSESVCLWPTPPPEWSTSCHYTRKCRLHKNDADCWTPDHGSFATLDHYEWHSLRRWWTKLHWGRFSKSASVPSSNSQCTEPSTSVIH
jgi:hypothetical protein